MKQSNKVIGRTAIIDVDSIPNIPAKVDTGADSSSIWASAIKVDNGELSFVLFDKESPFYSGKAITKQPDEYSIVKITSSSGDQQIRYAVILIAKVKGEMYKIRFTLSDRSTMLYPVLLGHHFLENRFLVDTTKNLPENVQDKLSQSKTSRLKAINREQNQA